MPEPKAQLVDPQGPIDVPGMQVTGVTTATGGFVGQVQGTATGFAATTYNLNVGIVTATKFQGNTTGNVSGLADDTNINVGIITSTSFTGDLVGNAAGLSTTTANINAGIMSATSFSGNFTGVASGITGTPNIVVGIMTGTLNGDGSSLTGIAATNWITNNVTANSSTTTVNLSLGNVVKFTQSANTTVSFANTGTSNIVTFIRTKDDTSTERTITWPSSIKWDGGSAPTLNTASTTNDANVITLLTRDEGVTWYGWETISFAGGYQMWVCGGNEVGGQVGLNLGPSDVAGYSSPVQIPGTTWFAIPNGQYTYGSGAIRSDGTLWMWGRNGRGQLGQNAGGSPTALSSPTQVGSGTNWKNLSHSSQSIMAVKTDGTLWAWGNNNNGQLGINDITDRSSPTQIPGTTWGTSKEKFALSPSQSMAIRTDGTLWTWGNNYRGELGQNQFDNPTHRSSPVQIPGTDWDKVSQGGHKAAIKTDGTLWTWGNNGSGNLGHNSRVDYSSPVQVPGTTWRSVFVAGGNSFATRTDGTLWAWGENGYGDLGLNTQGESYSSPVQVPGTNWSSTISTNGSFVVATKTDGTLWAWGANHKGPLGQNNRTKYSSPVQIPGTGWTDVFAGGETTMYALKSP